MAYKYHIASTKLVLKIKKQKNFKREREREREREGFCNKCSTYHTNSQLHYHVMKWVLKFSQQIHNCNTILSNGYQNFHVIFTQIHNFATILSNGHQNFYKKYKKVIILHQFHNKLHKFQAKKMPIKIKYQYSCICQSWARIPYPWGTHKRYRQASYHQHWDTCQGPPSPSHTQPGPTRRGGTESTRPPRQTH